MESAVPGRPSGDRADVDPSRRFGRTYRLRTRSEFSRVFEFGRSVADRNFVVYSRENGLAHSRLGVSVGRRVGGAVRRGRVKRLLREGFRLSRDRIPGGLDVLIIARGPGGPDELAAVRDALVALASRSVGTRPRPRRAAPGKGRRRRRGNRR